MATLIFRGDAPVVGQVSVCTLSGTWASGEKCNAVINGKSISITAPVAGLTAAQMVAALVAAINGDNVTAQAETRNTTGPTLPEFRDITAAVGSSSAQLKLTGDNERPFTVTVTEDAASGSAGSVTDTAGSGPSHIIAANFSGGALPSASDTVVFTGNRPVLYKLDALSAIALTAVVFESGFTANCGLADTFTNDAGTAYEYLPRYLVLDSDTILIGRGEGTGSGRIMVDCANAQTAIVVERTGSSPDRDRHAVQLHNMGASSTLEVTGGSVDVCREQAQTGTLTNARATGTARMRLGAGVTLTTCTADGSSQVECHAATTINCYGTAQVDKQSGAVTNLNVFGGTARVNDSGTITNTTLGAATLDLSRNTSGATFTNTTISAGGFSLLDPGAIATWTNDLAFTGVDPSAGVFRPGAGRSIGVS